MMSTGHPFLEMARDFVACYMCRSNLEQSLHHCKKNTIDDYISVSAFLSVLSWLVSLEASYHSTNFRSIVRDWILSSLWLLLRRQ